MARAGRSRSQSSLRRRSIIHHSPEIVMTAYTSHIEEVRALRSTRERIASLLGRYPHVSDKERKEILAFMKEGRHLEIGLLTSNDKVRPQLDSFMADHKRHFRVGAADVGRLLALFGVVAMFFWLLWELVRPASL